MNDNFFDYLEDHQDDETICCFPGWCVMGASPHMPQECVHLDDAAHYYEMLESEFTSTEEIGGES